MTEKSYSHHVVTKRIDGVEEDNLGGFLDNFKRELAAGLLVNSESIVSLTEAARAYYIVEMPSNDWKKGTCTCPSFYKTFICKHLIGMAMRYKLVEPPIAAKAVPLGQKRKRGRPRKVKHALLIN